MMGAKLPGPQPRSYCPLEFGASGERQGVVDVDPEVAHGAFDLRVSKEDLDGAQVTRPLVDDRCLRPP